MLFFLINIVLLQNIRDIYLTNPPHLIHKPYIMTRLRLLCLEAFNTLALDRIRVWIFKALFYLRDILLNLFAYFIFLKVWS